VPATDGEARKRFFNGREELTRIERPFPDLPRFFLDLSDAEIPQDPVRLLLESQGERERCTTVSAA
jgi:hypothetical protein